MTWLDRAKAAAERDYAELPDWLKAAPENGKREYCPHCGAPVLREGEHHAIAHWPPKVRPEFQIPEDDE